MESTNTKVRHITSYVFSGIYILIGLLMILTSPEEVDLLIIGSGMIGIAALLAENTHFIRKQQSALKDVPKASALDQKLSRQISRNLEADGEIHLSPEELQDILGGKNDKKGTLSQ